MTKLRRPLLLLGASAFAALALALTGCVASGGAYVGDGEYYYDAPGYVVYDGWGPTYYVGPPRGDHDHYDGHHDDHHDGHDEHHDTHGAPGHQGQGPPSYRPAPSGRAVPSIPSQSRAPARAPGKSGQ